MVRKFFDSTSSAIKKTTTTNSSSVPDGPVSNSHSSRSTASSGDATDFRDSAVMSSNRSDRKTSTLGHPPQIHSQQLQQQHQHPSAMEQQQKSASKKCTVCGKSFNPLRRRHYCRTCTSVVCSHCSISRKVESAFEGSITVRMCVSCKLSSIATQDDFYDRIFTGGGPNSSSDLTMSADRDSSGTYSSPVSSAREPLRSTSHASSNASSSTKYLDKRTTSSSDMTQHPELQRKSSAVSSQATNSPASMSASARRNSFRNTSLSTTQQQCPLCLGEACAPLRTFFEIPYGALKESPDQSGQDQYIAAKDLDHDKERLRAVRAIRHGLRSTSGERLDHLVSMASIAAQSPMVLVGLLDKDAYVPVAETGLATLEPIPKFKSLAAHTCRNGAPIVCSDLSKDVRFAGNPWRRDVLKAQFYAGIPIILSSGVIVGAVEVFDVNVRFSCIDVVAQLQSVVRGLVKKFDKLIASVPAMSEERTVERKPAPVLPPARNTAPQTSATEAAYVEVKPAASLPTPVRPPAPMAPPPARPTTPAPMPPNSSPAPTPAQTSASPAPSAAAQSGQQEMTQQEMEMKLMEMLSQTTSTQEQLRNQQSNMVHAIHTHSQQIGELAKQLERMESTLAAKLGGDAAAAAS